MRKAEIQNGAIVNVILVDPNNIPDWCSSWPEITGPYEIGDKYFGGVFSKKSSVEVPVKISFAQLLIGLVKEGWITEAEGDAWSQGVLPNSVTAVINTLPVDQRFAARTRARRPSEIVRNDPLVIELSASQGKTAEQLDQFFITYSQI